MRRFFTFVCLLIVAISTGWAQGWPTGRGAGTEGDPYLIANQAELETFRDLVNARDSVGGNDFSGEFIKLTADIELVLLTGDGKEGWAPIGKDFFSDYRFNGTFDGCGFTISGLWCNRPDQQYIGLFGATGPFSHIRNLTVEIDNSDNVKGLQGESWIGGLVGGNGGHITGCAVVHKANEAGIAIWQTTNIYGVPSGGLVGYNYNGSITNSYATVSVQGSGANLYFLGGLVGNNNEGSINNCYATGEVIAGGNGYYLGGLVGFSKGPITNCYATGDISGTGTNLGLGGLVGGYSNTTITNSFFNNDDNIDGVGDGDATGVTGKSLAELSSNDVLDALNTASGAGTWATNPLINNGLPYLVSIPDLSAYSTISDATVLANLATLVNEGFDFAGKTVTLGGNIDLSSWIEANSSTEGWTPIGAFNNSISNSKPFSGIFDGNGHTISGLWISRQGKNEVGLFGYVYGEAAEIKDLTVKIADRKSVLGHTHVGGLAGGVDKATITNCSVIGDVKGHTTVGGLVGSFIDGSLGMINSMTNCYATGNVEGGDNTGGLVGFTVFSTISNCYATGDVTGGNYTGGLVGNNNAIIFDCYSLGKVTGEGTPVGGLVGGEVYIPAEGTVYITNSFFLQEGDFNKDLPVTGTGNYVDAASSGKSTTDLRGQATFAGWDFADTWALSNTLNNGFPYLLALEDTYEPHAPITPDPDDTDPQTTSYTVTITAAAGIIAMPSAGTHSATIGGSFTFYVTLAEGFEGHTPQATVNGDMVELTLRPSGAEWMYVIPSVYDDMRVDLSFATTANPTIHIPSLYSRDGQLFIEATAPTTLTVYTIGGQTLVARRLSEGLTSIPLSTGIYIVRLDGLTKKIVVSN